MKRSTIGVIALSPVWLPLVIAGILLGLASWVFRGPGLGIAAVLFQLLNWVESFDPPEETVSTKA